MLFESNDFLRRIIVPPAFHCYYRRYGICVHLTARGPWLGFQLQCLFTGRWSCLRFGSCDGNKIFSVSFESFSTFRGSPETVKKLNPMKQKYFTHDFYGFLKLFSLARESSCRIILTRSQLIDPLSVRYP
jgi:hypothetical protein